MINIGMLGADSSHTETYIGLMNSPGAPFYGQAKVLKLWGRDVQQAKEKAVDGIEAVATPEEAVAGVDLVMVCSRWGDDHFPLAKAALQAGVPTYIDKPLTNSIEQAIELASLAASRNVATFSCSPYRYAPEIQELRQLISSLGDFRSGVCVGLSEWPDLGPRAREIYFYGIHPAEMIHAIFGSGMEAVCVENGPYTRIATIKYQNGHLVTLHLLRDSEEVYHISYYGSKGYVERVIDSSGAFYRSTLSAILSMVETGESPIPLSFAVEIIALLDAIERASKAAGWHKLRTRL